MLPNPSQALSFTAFSSTFIQSFSCQSTPLLSPPKQTESTCFPCLPSHSHGLSAKARLTYGIEHLCFLEKSGYPLVGPEGALTKLLLDFVHGAVGVQSRVVLDPHPPCFSNPRKLTCAVYMCVCACLCRCRRASGGLHGPPEHWGPSSCLLKLLATLGGEGVPDQGLTGPGGRMVTYRVPSETAVRAGLPVKLGLLKGITTLNSLHAESCSPPSLRHAERWNCFMWSLSKLMQVKGD